MTCNSISASTRCTAPNWCLTNAQTTDEAGLRKGNAPVIYLKSILVGVFAFVAALVLYGLAIIIYIRFYVLPKLPPSPHAEIGFDLSSMGLPLWPALILATVAFAAGFYQMFKWSRRYR